MTAVAYASLWMFVFVVPWERLVSLPGVSIVSRIAGAVAVGLTMLTIVIQAKIRRWHIFHLAALLFVVWAGIGAWVLQMGNIPRKLYTFIQLFLVVWMIWELASTPRRQRGLLAAYVFGCCVPAAATILLYLRVGGSMRRFSAGGADANDLAMTLTLALPMAWYLGMTARSTLLRWVFRGYLPLGMLATALTGSRGGMLAWMVALLIVPLTMKLTPGRLAAAIASLALSGALLVAYVPQKVVERLGTTTSEVEGARFGGRFKLWIAGVHAFEHRPLMGYGVGGYKAAITPELGDQALVAHNSFLSVLVEEGMVGLALYLTLLLSVYYSIRHLPRLERRFALVLLATLVTALMPLTWEEQKPVWIIWGTLIAISGPYLVGPRGAVARPLPYQAVRVSRGRPTAPTATPSSTARRNLSADGGD